MRLNQPPSQTFHGEKASVIDNSPASVRPPLAFQNGNSVTRAPANPQFSSESYSDEEQFDAAHSASLDHKERTPRIIQDHGLPESPVEQRTAAKGDSPEATHKKVPAGRHPNMDQDENSKWIHRDKLAKIESEELQAAGIFLPRQRDRARSKSQNRPKRDQSQDQANGSGRSIGGPESIVSRSRKNSAATTTDARTVDLAIIPSWDLRRPSEILEEVDGHWISNGTGKGSSRIPVAKTSPAPLPNEHLARDTRLTRKREGSPGEEDSITYPKPRARSGSTGNTLSSTKTSGASLNGQNTKRPDSSPKKTGTAAGARKPKPANGAAGRPKTRGGPSKDSTSSGTGTRPSTRSGDREFSTGNSKPMEGEPPWMVSAYRPDPRLPPDQQLLPTVAKRLQQEKWEREGKFGSVYDKEFRPLTDEGFLRPPEGSGQEQEAEKVTEEEQKDEQPGWPLKGDSKNSAIPGRSNSYSTMPKISDTPVNTMPSPRTPGHQSQPSQATKAPEPTEEPEDKKAGCGCCIVM